MFFKTRYFLYVCNVRVTGIFTGDDTCHIDEYFKNECQLDHVDNYIIKILGEKTLAFPRFWFFFTIFPRFGMTEDYP